MNPMPALEPALKQLRLSGILDSMEIRNKQAIEDGLSHVEFLAMLIQDEVARREQKKFSLRVRRAGFPQRKDLGKLRLRLQSVHQQGAHSGPGHLPLP